MNLRRHRFRLGLAAVLCLAASCGGEDGPGAPLPPGTDTVLDTKAPEFAGLAQATVVSEDRVELSWEPATDDITRQGRIAYAIYSASDGGDHDFSKPYGFTPAGANGAVLSGLVPTKEYYWVVRAVDEAGNEDQNVVERQATPPDETQPRFAGAVKVTAPTSRSLLVEWKPARDNATSEANMRYRVYVSSLPDIGSFVFDAPDVETEPGAQSVEIDGFDPLTDYYVVVRAVDEAGLEETNTLKRAAKTPEGEPPTFLGIKQGIALPEGVKLYWLPASDNVTEAANMVYTIHVSDQEIFSGDTLANPAFTTEPAALSFTIPGLTAGTRYWFIVRARDTAGNSDANSAFVTLRAVSGTDTSAPTFDGVGSVISESPSTLLVSWLAATDDVTPASRMVYDVFAHDTAGVAIPAGATPTLSSAPGATSVTLTGLLPQSTRHVVVRARDEAGNSLANNVEMSGASLARPPGGDLTAPVWGGAAPVAVMPGNVPDRPFKLDVSWSEATDAVALAADIRYHVCAEELEADCLGAAFTKHIRASSDWGQTAVVINGLFSRTRYFVYVRAEDNSGNMETGAHGGSRTTATSYQRDVQPILIDRCNGCHSFDIPSLVEVPSGYSDPRLPAPPCNEDCSNRTGISYVDPGFPERSLIYRQINPRGLTTPPFSDALSNEYTGMQEPRDGIGTRTLPLTGAEDGAIRDWILQGALGQ